MKFCIPTFFDGEIGLWAWNGRVGDLSVSDLGGEGKARRKFTLQVVGHFNLERHNDKQHL